MMKLWLKGSLMSATAIGTMVAAASISYASADTTYHYPSSVHVYLTNADTSLQPVPQGTAIPTGLNFYFFNHAPTFTPTGSDGKGTFSYTDGSGTTTAFPTATSITFSGKDAAGDYIYNVGVPQDYQNSTSDPQLWVFSNYQWQDSNGTPVDDYSTLVNLVQQLPELPFAALVPAAIGAVFIAKRRKGKSTTALAQS